MDARTLRAKEDASARNGASASVPIAPVLRVKENQYSFDKRLLYIHHISVYFVEPLGVALRHYNKKPNPSTPNSLQESSTDRRFNASRKIAAKTPIAIRVKRSNVSKENAAPNASSNIQPASFPPIPKSPLSTGLRTTFR